MWCFDLIYLTIQVFVAIFRKASKQFAISCIFEKATKIMYFVFVKLTKYLPLTNSLNF